MKALGENEIMGFAQGEISGCRVGSDDAESDAVGGFFVQRDEKRRIEGSGIVGVEQLQAFNDAPADKQLSVDSNFA